MPSDEYGAGLVHVVGIARANPDPLVKALLAAKRTTLAPPVGRGRGRGKGRGGGRGGKGRRGGGGKGKKG